MLNLDNLLDFIEKARPPPDERIADAPSMIDRSYRSTYLAAKIS
jgi:hypothetical protein